VVDRRIERGLQCARVSMRLREQVAALRSRDSDRTGKVPNEQALRCDYIYDGPVSSGDAACDRAAATHAA
jgi:hypothetical protein